MSEIFKDDSEWQQQLTQEEYQICRCGGTERAFTGKYYNHKEQGTYTCLCCGEPLFSSEHKYDSGSGWPSYWQPVSDGGDPRDRRSQPWHGSGRSPV